MAERVFLTSESVTEGHPDKVCDQISDAVLDSILERDPNGRVACETLVSTGLVLVAGEVTTDCYVDIPRIVRETIQEIGYTDAKTGFDYETCAVLTAIQEQSPDIAQGVDLGGAGDQGMMYGFATRETPELMPLPIMLAHRLVRQLTELRKTGILPYLRPDGKSQVTVEYKNAKPFRVDAVIMAAQHNPEVSEDQVKRDVLTKVVKRVIPGSLLDDKTKYYVNPTGRFVVGGPQGDTGVTGRKIIVDTYGGLAKHGGGCFSGKDPSKVDRSASYMCRYVAKNVVAAGLADKCEIQVAYAIGIAEPISVVVNTYGTGTISDDDIVHLIRQSFDLTPKGMIDTLALRRPIFRRTAAYGHFGREEEGFTWEVCNMVDTLKRAAKKRRK